MNAAFSGSFDPISYGHLNIIERAQPLFDKLVIAVAENRQKATLFSPEERVAMIEDAVRPWKNVSVVTSGALLVDLLREHDIRVLVRGIRGIVDFSYEYEMAMLNKGLAPDIETFFMPANPAYIVLRSSSIKELASFGGDITAMVPPRVAEAVRKKFAPKEG